MATIDSEEPLLVKRHERFYAAKDIHLSAVENAKVVFLAEICKSKWRLPII